MVFVLLFGLVGAAVVVPVRIRPSEAV